MAKFTSTKALNIRWFGNAISGAAGATHRIPDALVDEFTEDFGQRIPGLTWITQDETTNIAASAITVTSLTATTAHFKGEPWYDVKAYGAVGDGVTDDRAAIQSAIAAVTASGTPGVIAIPHGTYKISSPGLTVDASYHAILGFGAVLDASTMTTGNVLTVRGTIDPPYLQATQSYQGFRIVGPGMTTGTVVGVILTESTTLGIGPSHLEFSNIVVQNCATAMKFGTGAYTIGVIASNFFSNGTCLYTDTTVFNGGEQLSFTNTRFHSSNLAVYAKNVNCEFFFSGCSFDYNAKQFDINDARVNLSNCHVEAGKTTYTSVPITVAGNGGTFVMMGGWILQTGATTASNGHVIDCSAAGGGAWLYSVFINNSQTSSGLFATGTGHVSLIECSAYSTSDNPRFLSTAMNLLSDGGFEQTTIKDDVFISDDTAAITSRTNGADIDLSTSTAQANSGSRSLRVDKAFGTGSAAAFTVAVPIQRGSHPAHRFYYRKPGTETGTMFIDTAFARIGVNGDGVPIVLQSDGISSGSVVFTSSAVAWTKVDAGEPTERAPAWATHFTLVINLVSLDAGAYYFDDILITEM